MQRIRDRVYRELEKEKRIHGKWVSEYRLFSLVKLLFDDAIFQYSCNWLGKQILDIYVPSIRLAIEYQGKQHYEQIDYFGTEEDFKATQMRDANKKMLCEDNNIRLLYWPYEWKINMWSLSTLLRGSVPDKFLDEQRIDLRVSMFNTEDIVHWGTC